MSRIEEIKMFNDVYIYTGNMDNFVKIEHVMYNIKLPYNIETFHKDLEDWLKFHDIDDDVTIIEDCLHKYRKINMMLQRRTEEILSTPLNEISKDFSNISKIKTIIIFGMNLESSFDRFSEVNHIQKLKVKCNVGKYDPPIFYYEGFIDSTLFILCNYSSMLISAFNITYLVDNLLTKFSKYDNLIIINVKSDKSDKQERWSVLFHYKVRQRLSSRCSSKILVIDKLPTYLIRDVIRNDLSKNEENEYYSLERILSNPEPYIIKNIWFWITKNEENSLCIIS